MRKTRWSRRNGRSTSARPPAAQYRHREGVNSTIKVIKRRADGYRDDESFFVKIRAAFPGNPR
ncbi:transposase [Burkholderia pyrrocinia]|uniref:transposase n=1 Tax=Burkholderia pyrrocinia TaxID=60550 RepID=UPI0039F254A0